MKVTARLFARVRDIVGTETIVLEVPEAATMDDLRRQLVAQQSALQNLAPHLMFAVGTRYVTDDSPVTPDTEVAVIPPVSGG